ncbi:possible general secretory pathway protein [Aurantimonas manganoxydans SI85-9A1]|uniref:Possible general secretory pathway protein n=1 Tax=Aurantimonas manganoxydans (strain ATCC BAA-1229 / DSM 21871 / SI85-9A1) TaxID=287752 RepID=Q1YMR3_AURMS|nr:type II secretion system F family protein [Aurantimonas manganoxydans]EAS51318.1 possible general secretory pathway protein [Aurantimonas manganoxydans SI85-9A1]
MTSFAYQALTPTGHIVAGTLEGPTRAAISIELERQSLLPIEIAKDVPRRQSLSSGITALFAQRPGAGDVTRVTEDLSALLTAGVALDRAILIISQTATKPVIAVLLRDLHQAISMGQSLAEATGNHPTAFPANYVKIVQVAEAAGTLPETLAVLARERQRSEELRRRISSALAYPGFLAAAAVGVLAFVLAVVIPEFDRALSGSGSPEGPAQTIFWLSRTFRTNGTEIVIVTIVALLAGLWGARSRAIRERSYELFCRLPGLRRLASDARTVTFCANLGLLIRSDVDISSALRLIRDTMIFDRDRQSIDAVLAEVRQGRRLSDSLESRSLLPTYAVHMLRVGEESGLGAAATRTALYYEARLDRGMTRAVAILGPTILLLVSGLIAWIIISVMTALLSMNEMIL